MCLWFQITCLIINSNRTEWSTIRGVTGWVISNQPSAKLILNYEHDYPWIVQHKLLLPIINCQLQNSRNCLSQQLKKGSRNLRKTHTSQCWPWIPQQLTTVIEFRYNLCSYYLGIKLVSSLEVRGKNQKICGQTRSFHVVERVRTAVKTSTKMCKFVMFLSLSSS